jgi:membrane protein YdbS with pleckstrin-like domain
MSVFPWEQQEDDWSQYTPGKKLQVYWGGIAILTFLSLVAAEQRDWYWAFELFFLLIGLAAFVALIRMTLVYFHPVIRFRKWRNSLLDRFE